MPPFAQRTRSLLLRLFGPRVGKRPAQAAAAVTDLPEWAQTTKKRRAHVRRMVALLNEWADEMDVTSEERKRWLTACWLHDALRDAELPEGISHGPAAAELAASHGETDRGVLSAVRYHSVGYARWDDVGKMLYLADFLEPGRKSRRKWRAQLAKRVPKDRDGVLRQILAQQIRSRLRRERPVEPLTVEFWNSLTRRRD
ncbi:MAG TPA: HD domain-containing protein [Gemmatimonadaceae bacterium]|nr:HD domain-containing protein [Gemmatimonadaceae bacterium]